MLKHNSYFEGGVQSIGFARNNMHATVGVILPKADHSAYHFGTEKAERMTVISGSFKVNLGDGWQIYAQGTAFEIAANSGFDIAAVGGAAVYLCEFLG